MFLVMLLWWLAMVSGLCWSALVTGVLTASTLIGFIVENRHVMGSGVSWLQLAVLGLTPWLLAAEQDRQTSAIRVSQAKEAERMMRLSEAARSLMAFEDSARQMERSIAEITEVYHVTKETSRALRSDELFQSLIDAVSRMMSVHGLRLLDLARPDHCIVWRAAAADGRLRASDPGRPDAVERAIIQVAQADQPGETAEAAIHSTMHEALGLSWCPLLREQRPIGVLIAEGLEPAQRKKFLMIADQLALQLSRSSLYQQVEALAVTDSLTGLWVRRYFLERAEEELARSKRHGLSCTLLMADLDRFKEKNDLHGHLVGDVVLRDISKLLKSHLREVDLIARFGGEEFILLLIETTVDQAAPIAERLRQLVEVHPIHAYDELLSQTVSIGMAGFPMDAGSLRELIDAADHALLEAKRSGRNRVVRSDQLAPGALRAPKAARSGKRSSAAPSG